MLIIITVGWGKTTGVSLMSNIIYIYIYFIMYNFYDLHSTIFSDSIDYIRIYKNMISLGSLER